MEFKLEYTINEEIKTFYLNKDTVTTGKLSGNDLQLSDNSVSRNHCKFVKAKNTYKIIDMGSTNGTYVNGRRVTEKKLEKGDTITIGRTILKFLAVTRKETYTDVDDQKISMVVPLSEKLDELKVKEKEEIEVEKLNLLASLTLLGKALIASTTLEDSFEKIGELIFEFLHPKRLFIFFYDENQEQLELKYCHTRKGKTQEKVNISKTIAMKAIKEKVAILSSNTLDDDRFDGAQSIIMYGITSAISVPIWTKKSIYGLIYIDTTEFDKIFKENDLEILSIIANFAGLSIEGINSLEKLNREKKIRGRLERYFSPSVVSRIMEGHDSSTLEMKTYKETEATVLFMDIVGFTPKVEHMNPVEIGVFLNNFFTEMTEIIFKNNGTLDKYMGDGIMAVFGVPFEIDNHAELAIQTALEMIKRLDEMNEILPKEDKIKIRIGINSGKLIAGDFGSPRRLDYTVIGNNVNIASRLESSVAGINDIAISEATHKIIKNQFDCKPLGEKKLQGLSKPVKTFKVIGEKNKESQ
ncbi:MAG: FHA domain-containing protein [Candidatus Aminicenantes bacterium]|nr:FHA domain-containing protein [Candidatus Aminicenantes bacterium]NIM80848.1 FHA domain-containing protein [Candidatus Aminicenantes bacterium]NIN20232.1 FHA domain-containing protein [Candidatus Aminicenantes bacterium]NIN44011.1 FHA domain-containing protein [Candidatus Aminicenantes bacterium]NIN86820.1 FHA domain-containing protein [Candidatus Aminicenantes bacterium]